MARDAADGRRAAGGASRPARQLAGTDARAVRRPSRRDLLHLLEGRSITDLDPNVLAALASLDGAHRDGSCAAVCWLPARSFVTRRQPNPNDSGVVEGARTTAALAASRFGPVLKVSEDGIITFFDGELGY